MQIDRRGDRGEQETLSKRLDELEELSVIRQNEDAGRIVFRDRLARLYLAMAATLGEVVDEL